MHSTNVPHINTTVNENELEHGVLSILEIIRPTWDKAGINLKVLTEGITNKLIACKLKTAPASDTVLVRIYGNKTDLLIDRNAETRNIILLNKVGLAPELYATFDNGLAYRYIPGKTLNADTVTNPKIYKLVAKKMANLHGIEVPGRENLKPCLWDKLHSFWNLIPDGFTDENKQKRYLRTVVSKQRILEEIQYLRNILEKLNSPIVFAHNDLLLGNIIYTEEQDMVTFIDYEYAAMNFQAYDIGNHFAEFVGLEEVDYSKYPNKDLQYDWLKTYLTELNGREPLISEVTTLFVQVNQFCLISHVFWGIWSLIQAEHSYIEFDFLEYAALRFKEYFLKKDAFLSLQLPQ